MKVALYPRVSTAEQAENGHSISEQVARMKDYCKAMGWLVYEVYTDAGFSGASMDRPGLRRLIQDVKANKVDKVLVYKLDRLSRSQKDTLYLIEDVFLSNCCDFVSMSENFDTATPFGRAMIGILAVFAQLEREQIKERLGMGRDARAKLGLFHGGSRVPIGYDYKDGRLVPNPSEAAQVQEAFARVAGGAFVNHVIRDFTKKGYSHKYGDWSERTLRSVLRSRTYVGELLHKGQWVPGAHEPLVSLEVYEKAQHNMDSRLKPAKSRAYLTGFLVCSQCGAKYGKRTMKQKSKVDPSIVYEYNHYICYSQMKSNPKLVRDPDCNNKKWKMDELDEAVFSQLRQLTLDPIEKEPEQDTAELLELKKIDGQLSKLMDLYALGNMPMDVLSEKVEAIKEKREKLLAALSEYEKEKSTKATRTDALEALSTLDTVIQSGNYDDVRAVLAMFIDRIELNGDKVAIYWKI